MNIESNQKINIRFSDSQNNFLKDPKSTEKRSTSFLQSVKRVSFKHEANDLNDYYTERLLPQKYSMQGPGIAAGDANNDGLDDIIISSDRAKPKVLLVQQTDGTFNKTQIANGEGTMGVLGTSSLFFDYDGDNDLDLYTGYGGNLYLDQDPKYADRIYKNNGSGTFTLDEVALPKFFESTSSVTAADYDKDGDLDLFVAGRVKPKNFPLSPKSYLLENVNGIFKDVSYLLPKGNEQGMVSQALWTDFNNDGLVDLIIVGDMMPITFLKNNGNNFEDVTHISGIETYFGLWNSISGGDFDNDGDIDYIVGNIGGNNPYKPSIGEPIEWFVSDFDKNGSIDAVMTYYNHGKRVPVHPRDQLIEQLPFIKKRFPDYEGYAKATLNDIFTSKELATAKNFKTNYLLNSYVENLGSGKFSIKPLPIEAQFSSIFGTIVIDINNDDNLDIITQGNNYAPQVQMGQYDASIGAIFIGNGKGGFINLKPSASGFYVPGDARAIALLRSAQDETMIVSTRHNDSLSMFTLKNYFNIPLKPSDKDGILELGNGKTRKVEFYFGQGHLSQSTRYFNISKNSKLTIQSFNGTKRKIQP